jgi:hypothetical protein
MSRCTQLAVILSLAACEHATPATHEPQFVTQPAPAVKAEPPKPAPVPEPAPSEPAPPEAASEPAIAPVPEAQPVMNKGCAMTRAGCKWKDEKPVKRVTKKPPHEGDLE